MSVDRYCEWWDVIVGFWVLKVGRSYDMFIGYWDDCFFLLVEMFGVGVVVMLLWVYNEIFFVFVEFEYMVVVKCLLWEMISDEVCERYDFIK